MKLNNDIEIKPGMWITNGSDFARIAALLADDWFVFYWRNNNTPKTAKALRDGWKDWRIASPAELSAAGVDDSLRLVEQRSEWEGVTFKALTDKYHPQDLVSVHIDNSHAFYARANGFLEIGTPHLYGYRFDVTGQCDPLRARPDVLQAVVKFRSERREAGLKWMASAGCPIRRRGSHGEWEYWIAADSRWCLSVRDDADHKSQPDATAEQIAQSGVPLDDVPEPLRAAVRKQREAASPSPAATRTDVEGDTFSINSLDGNVYTLKAFIDRHGIARLDLNFTPADAPVDLELARAGIVRVREMISKCFRTDRTSDDLFELGLAIADVRKGLGLPSYLSTLTPSGDGETEK